MGCTGASSPARDMTHKQFGRQLVSEISSVPSGRWSYPDTALRMCRVRFLATAKSLSSCIVKRGPRDDGLHERFVGTCCRL